MGKGVSYKTGKPALIFAFSVMEHKITTESKIKHKINSRKAPSGEDPRTAINWYKLFKIKGATPIDLGKDLTSE